MYVLLRSTVTQETGKANALEYVKEKVADNVSSQMETISVKVINPGATCIQLTGFLSSMGISNRVIVLDDSGNRLTAGTSGSDLQINRDSQTFFRIYESDGFSPVTTPIGSCASPTYDVGASKTETLVFETKVLELLANYTANYENVKKNLSIGSTDEFGFIFTYNNRTTIETSTQNLTVNVYASQTPIQYIKTDGTREAGYLAVLVW